MTTPHRILVVDDSTADRLAVSAALEKASYDVRVADGVEAAEDVLREFTPHVVVIDWSMYRAGPLERATVGGGGAQLLRRIRARVELRNVVVIVYSSGRKSARSPSPMRFGLLRMRAQMRSGRPGMGTRRGAVSTLPPG